MLESQLWMVGALGTLLLMVAVLTDVDEIVFGALGFVVWIVFAYGATAVTVYTDCCGPVTETQPALALLGLLFAVVSLYVLLKGTGALVREEVADRTDAFER